jgi:hypothetical protein
VAAGPAAYLSLNLWPDFEIPPSLLGLMIHMIRSMPCAEASIVTNVPGVPSRDIRTDACPFVSNHASVRPVQKCEAKEAMNFATFSRPETGARAAVRTIPPPSE